MNSMKTKVLLMAVAMTVATAASAQKNDYYKTRHEIGVTIGVGATTEIFSGLSDLMPFEASKMFPLLSRHKARLRPVFPLVLGFLCHLLLNTIGRQIWLYKYYANFWRKSWQTEDQLCHNNTVAKW